jgi:hypothetical protein
MGGNPADPEDRAAATALKWRAAPNRPARTRHACATLIYINAPRWGRSLFTGHLATGLAHPLGHPHRIVIPAFAGTA